MSESEDSQATRNGGGASCGGGGSDGRSGGSLRRGANPRALRDSKARQQKAESG